MKDSSPPKIIFRFLQWFCPPHLYEGIEGDLAENYEADLQTLGPAKAKLLLAWNVLKFFRPGIILRNNMAHTGTHTYMIGNYIKIASRNIVKRKLYSFINAAGLSIAIAFCTLIYLFIQDEKSFDQFHENKHDIYQLLTGNFNVKKLEAGAEDPYNRNPYLPARLGEVMLSELPEVRNMTRFINYNQGILRYGDKVFNQSYTGVDSGFFNMFSFKILSGNSRRPLRALSDVVLTPALAHKIFGDEDPIGKIFTLERDGSQAHFTVTALVEAPPHNSSLTFEMLVQMDAIPWFVRSRDNWGNSSFPTFVQLQPGAGTANLKAYLDEVIRVHMHTFVAGWTDWLKPPPGYAPRKFEFQKLLDVHLAKNVYWHGTSDPMYSWILAGIGMLILAIACINYISLALTTSASRRVEVGIRKVVGAQKKQIGWQFTIESLLLSVLSMLIGLLLVVVFLPYFNEFTGKGIALTLPAFWSAGGIALVLAVAIGFVAGSYPALYLSGFLPALVLKGRFTSRLQAGFTRPLVVFQFFLSASMIICSVVMYRQMNYLTTKDLGFAHEQVVVIPTQTGWNAQANQIVSRYREALKTNPSVVGVSGVTASFSKDLSRYGYTINGQNKDSFVYGVDTDYIPLLDIQLTTGRNFDGNIISDSSAVIVNEALARDMKWDDPLHEHLNWAEDSASLGSPVIGVMKDYHYASLQNAVEPMFISLKIGYLTTIMVKLTGGDTPAKIEQLKSTWSTLFPDRPFEYSFLDQDLAAQYDIHKRWSKIMGLSTVFAILIACLGLFGLSGINAMDRTKEIGIRKVMGARLSSIFILLNRQYVLLASVAFILAIPLSWYAMHQWLSSFQFSITIGAGVFVVSMAAGLLIALVTVSYHAIKASLINPAETLKHE